MRECNYCNGELKKPWQKKFCSWDCSNKGTAKSNSASKMGENNPMYGKVAPNYKGGTITRSGSRNVKYIQIHVNGKIVKKHRHIMENYLGRKLKATEVVHHIDGDGLNNNIENLEVMTKSEHSRHHADVSYLIGGGA